MPLTRRSSAVSVGGVSSGSSTNTAVVRAGTVNVPVAAVNVASATTSSADAACTGCNATLASPAHEAML